MARYVALLRGVNVGGRSLPMAELARVVEGLGHRDVRTDIQSGNVVFGATGKVDVPALERAIGERFSLDVGVALRSAAELRRVIDRNPFPDAEVTKLHVGFLLAKPPAGTTRALDGAPYAPEEFVLQGSEVYLHLPNGMGRAKLPVYLGRRLPVAATYRNWRTVTTLAEMTA